MIEQLEKLLFRKKSDVTRRVTENWNEFKGSAAIMGMISKKKVCMSTVLS